MWAIRLAEWETWGDIRARSELAGFSVSRDQLERWRSMELLPRVKQVGLGRAAGSEIRYPVGTIDQVIAIAAAFAIKRKKDFVGWRLWLQGYEVGERYWRAHIDAALPALREAQQWMIEAINRDDFSDETDFDRLAPALIRRLGLDRAVRFLPDGMASYIAATFGEIIAGQFNGFSPGHEEEEFLLHLKTFQAAMGIPRRGKAAKIINELGFLPELENKLRHISTAFSKIKADQAAINDFMKPDIRNEFWLSMQILHDSHAIFVIFGGSPFRMADEIISRPDIQAPMLIIWAVFRKFGSIKLSDEIRQIADIARTIGMLIEPKLTLKSLEETADFR